MVAFRCQWVSLRFTWVFQNCALIVVYRITVSNTSMVLAASCRGALLCYRIWHLSAATFPRNIHFESRKVSISSCIFEGSRDRLEI